MKKPLSCFLYALSLCAFSLSQSSLFADHSIDVTVSADDGTGSVENTLSWAINQANNDRGATIALEVGPVISGNMPDITRVVEISGPYTIASSGGPFSAISSTGGITTIGSDVILGSSTCSVNGGYLSFAAASNWTGVTEITLDSDGVVVFPTADGTSYVGDISVGTGDGFIYLGDSTSSTFTLSGTIYGVDASSLRSQLDVRFPVTLEGGSVLDLSGTIQNLDMLTIGTPGKTVQITGVMDNIETIDLLGPVVISGGWESGSDGATYYLNSAATLEISSMDNLQASDAASDASVQATGGTLYVTGDTSFGDADMFILTSSLAARVTLHVDKGATLTIPEVLVTATSSREGSYDAYLTLTGAGTCSLSAFSLYGLSSTGDISLYVDGDLGGTEGLTLSNDLGLGLFLLAVDSAQSYTGDTVIGTYTDLQVNGRGSLGHSSDNIRVDSWGYLYVQDLATVTAHTLTNNGFISGCGTFDVTTIINKGRMRTGCSSSTMTVDGDLTSSPGSIISVFLESADSSDLVVTGDVTFEDGVTLQINPQSGCYSRDGTTHSILTAGSLTGTFGTVSIDSSLLSATVSYRETGADITVTLNPFTTVATSGNANAVAGAVDTLIDNGDAAICSATGSFIPLSAAAVKSSLNQLQPAQFKALAVTQENSAVKVRDTINYRFQKEIDAINCPTEEKPFHVWVSGMGDSLYQASANYKSSYQVGFNESMSGLSVGLDYHFAKYLYAGVLGAYTDAKVKWHESQGTGYIKTGYAGLYLSAIGQMYYANLAVMGGWSHYNANRNINLSSESLTASNTHGGSQILSHLDLGMNINCKWFVIRPFNSFDYISQTENAFTEKNAGTLNLSVRKSNAIMARNELGLNFSGCFDVKETHWTISPKISWVREARVKGSRSTVSFEGTGVEFTTIGYFPNRSLVSPGVSITGNMLNDLLTLTLYYNGEFKGNYSDNSYGGEIRFGF
jgi:uncharacterized protein with beta-barrel porin domain